MRLLSNLEDSLGYIFVQPLHFGALHESICHLISANYASLKCENANNVTAADA